MKKEQQYDFRKKLLEIHKPNLRNMNRQPSSDEFMLKNNTIISINGNLGKVTETAVADFIDFLNVSMNLSSVSKYNERNASIKVALASEFGIDLSEVTFTKGFLITVNQEGISIYGHDEKGIAQGLYYIETLMEFNQAPILSYGEIRKKPIFYPRMVHSGYGLDEYPDEYLSRIAHEGRDVILVFTKGVNETPNGYLDFNDLIDRAANYGLEVYAYSYLTSNMSPKSPGAEEFYDNTYGKLFKECPHLGGVTLVGESVEFPSEDPNVAKGRYFEIAKDGIPSDKPSSGWYPCKDYPDWLNLIKKTIRKYNENADIVFWTYNWGYQPEEARVKLIESLPTDISLQATFEMFQPRTYGRATGYCADYTLSFEGPSRYFESEAIAAKKRGIRLYSMTNTGGRTWDIGTIPYQPMPYQWIRRLENMCRAHDDWGLCGLMETHHYGFTPSFISKLSNLALLEPREPMEAILEKIIIAEYGKENENHVKNALMELSESIRHFTPGDFDQYGAFRSGPSYPFCLAAEINIPSSPDAMFGNRIIAPAEHYQASSRCAPLFMRINEEIASLKVMLSHIENSIEQLEAAPMQNENLQELLNLARFIRNTSVTGIHAKEWHIMKAELFFTSDTDRFSTLLSRMETLLHSEIDNAKSTIPLVEADSRLGWEPSMLYICDHWHLEWKIRQCNYVLNHEIKELYESLKHVN